ncbi:MAG: ATP-dependent DNA helicase RecG, partial [Ruminococcus sp.]|nr:ATP-dependent DNA helicase RecG [Ruminococcus sp.]
TPFKDILPFEMTDAQIKAITDCGQDMMLGERMSRLIQGDVGSGKTVVAACMAYFVYLNGWQSCMMAPTEILAAQHYETFKKYLEPLGVRVALLSGGMKPKQKKEVQQGIADGSYNVVVGTHALFYGNTEFKDLALVITDEQHRFGVEQRRKLAAKGRNPHTIVMSATPIPRTLALMLYGDLQVSVIDELPAGRKPVETYAVTGKMRERAYGFVKKQLDAGHQGFIVCPAVEESELDIKNAKSYYEELQGGVFADYKLGLLYGKMSSGEKESVMGAFKEGIIDLLVSTTVVEVGVDVPNATIMVVENADRFGLSQLHQLRGRVGRGGDAAYCVLITDNTSPDNVRRMKAISGTNDGFKVAEEDLRLRGPGDFFGTQQHGLPAFKIADLTRDVALLEKAQKLSSMVISEDPALTRSKNRVLKELVVALLRRGSELS